MRTNGGNDTSPPAGPALAAVREKLAEEIAPKLERLQAAGEGASELREDVEALKESVETLGEEVEGMKRDVRLAREKRAGASGGGG